MKLPEMNIAAFSELLASDAPAPGGGSTAALAGALGVSLSAMVAGLTVGKKKYADHEELAKSVMKNADGLQKQLLDLMDRDTEAFNGVSAVFAMPKETDEQKTARSEAMQKALKACTLTPFEMMECALKALELTRSLVGKSNDSAASDLGVAALSLKTGIQGAWLNVLINISGIKDAAFADTYRKNGEALLAKALPLADEIYEHVLAAVSA